MTNHPSNTYKKLYRSNNNYMLAGICGGLGEYFNIDPTIMRLIFIFLFFLGGITFLIYIIMWVIVPLDGHARICQSCQNQDIEKK